MTEIVQMVEAINDALTKTGGNFNGDRLGGRWTTLRSLNRANAGLMFYSVPGNAETIRQLLDAVELRYSGLERFDFILIRDISDYDLFMQLDLTQLLSDYQSGDLHYADSLIKLI